jgi:hypothetical protein
MINERKLQEIENISNALNELKKALESEEFTNDFEFKEPADATKELKQSVLKAIATQLNERGIGFDPSLIIQHIEKEVLNQFNDIVVANLKGKSVKQLLSYKHELEKFDLVDRVEFFTNKLKTLESELGVSNEEGSKTSKKANKKAK